MVRKADTKKKLTLAILSENYDWCKEKELNMSRFLDMKVDDLRAQMGEPRASVKKGKKVFIISADSVINTEKTDSFWQCEGRDSNPRTPERPAPEAGAFNLAWLPSLDSTQTCFKLFDVLLIIRAVLVASNRKRTDKKMGRSTHALRSTVRGSFTLRYLLLRSVSSLDRGVHRV